MHVFIPVVALKRR